MVTRESTNARGMACRGRPTALGLLPHHAEQRGEPGHPLAAQAPPAPGPGRPERRAGLTPADQVPLSAVASSAGPFCSSSAFMTGESVTAAFKPMKSGSTIGGICDASYMSNTNIAERLPEKRGQRCTRSELSTFRVRGSRAPDRESSGRCRGRRTCRSPARLFSGR